jgi:hypothetical protein
MEPTLKRVICPDGQYQVSVVVSSFETCSRADYRSSDDHRTILAWLELFRPLSFNEPLSGSSIA